MNKILLLFFSFYIFNSAIAQNRTYQLFKMDLASGLVFPTGDTFLEGRILFSIEPKYNLTDRSSLGLRLEFAPNTNFAGTVNPLFVRNVLSFLLAGEYFFDLRKTRSFVGAGTGIFNQYLSNGGYPEIKTNEQVFGIVTRAGIELKRFRLAIEFNTA